MADGSAPAAKRQKKDAVAIGDSIPADITLDFGFPPEKINLAERCAGKKIILLGLPGAFTPT